jgi:hypothetical protein
MAPILGIWASSKATVAADTGAMFPLQVITVGSAGASSVEFTNIPNTYTHLQLRYTAQTNRGTYGIAEYALTFNSDTATNYGYHAVYGDGAGTTAIAYSTQNSIRGDGEIGTSTGGTFGGGVLDILDYANTNKNKTVRWLGGVDINGTIAGFGGRVGLFSGLWRSTSAITSVKLVPYTGSLFTQNSSFALYGIKGA